MAYTKYSLTPADNNAAPPNGAPEGMLPSAVNDTMRDMMAQIRDVGDGIRGGTYTMTAPVITGGSITGVALSGNTLTNPVITGGSINNTPIGASTANTGAFTTLGATGVATFSAGTVSAPAITTTGDTNTGIFFPAADTIGFTEGGVEAMRIDSAGSVGIGTTNPPYQFSVSNGTSTVGFTPQSTIGYAGTHSNHAFGFLTNNIERMRIDNAGNVGIGATTVAGYSVYSAKNVTGATNTFGILQAGTVQSDVTAAHLGFATSISTQASAFTLTTLMHYNATQATIGATSAITNQQGYGAGSSLTGATNNYGFFGNIAAGTGRWNLFMNGTANNYLAGSLGIGTTSNLDSSKLVIGGTLPSASANSRAVFASYTIPSTTTGQAVSYLSFPNTQATSFSVSQIFHFYANQGTIGLGSSATNQYGFIVESTLTGATNDYGFFGNLAAATGVFNLYMAGTADNYLAGKLTVSGSTAIPAGGTAGVGVNLSTTANFGVFFGSGAPTLSAAKGSLYLRSDGTTTNNRMYVNTDGSTTWTAVTTAA